MTNKEVMMMEFEAVTVKEVYRVLSFSEKERGPGHGLTFRSAFQICVS